MQHNRSTRHLYPRSQRFRTHVDPRQARAGFTLIELLVVMAIIGIIIALLVPAVNLTRESAKQLACQNNLRAIGSAIIDYEGTMRHYPTGGAQSYTDGQVWGSNPNEQRTTHLVARNDCGNSPCADQTWGWQFQILPFLGDGNNQLLYNSRDEGFQRGAVISTFHCPSDPGDGHIQNKRFLDEVQHEGLPLLAFGGTDYAGNIGVGLPNSLSPLVVGCGAPPPNIKETEAGPFVPRGKEINQSAIKDGVQHTIFVGEPWADPDHVGEAYHGHVVGLVGGWAETNACGISEHFPTDTLRMVTDRFGPNAPPESLSGILYQSEAFGGWHPGVAFFLMGDGSVHGTDFGVSRDVLRKLGTRSGHEFLDGTEF